VRKKRGISGFKEDKIDTRIFCHLKTEKGFRVVVHAFQTTFIVGVISGVSVIFLPK
jgi:hypothetical protein